MRSRRETTKRLAEGNLSGTLPDMVDPAAALVASALSSSVRDVLRRVRVEKTGDQSGIRIRYVTDEETQAALEALPETTREAIKDVADDAAVGTGGGVSPVPTEPSAVAPVEAGAALTLAPQLFKDARSRISLMFRIRLGLAVLLAVILIVALAACIFSVLTGEEQLALLFGGLTLIDVLAFAFGKPLKAVTDAVVASQRLELVHLRVQVDINSCATLRDPEARIQCQSAVWKSIQDELVAMGG